MPPLPPLRSHQGAPQRIEDEEEAVKAEAIKEQGATGAIKVEEEGPKSLAAAAEEEKVASVKADNGQEFIDTEANK